ncbi:MAG: hypothetical protein A3J58_02865 [Candidatus Sungbacteria bacterium RIFCSPHIGHO2_02_FULL_52_23]|uniref:FAD/NAD(P)-binding domain-containing protein n=1 Tax=Candidatus Sungbacteria bacterium RIFCSPHIGHO2_02_FULL_52_23 TaxID=1802274 RepID=A0A1G2KT89_9BACT|nr:MAG: hypothetical protein A3J58_02865 [Candidatus Sungbacteria bacterium RIFCSPHIGHO2_02_FULL_52_23]
MYDIIVIGGGPAGVAAAVYTARKRLRTLLISESFGGQSIVSDDIQNWIGEPHISGFELAQKMEAHVRSYSDIVDIKTERAGAIAEKGRDFEVRTEQGNTYEGKVVILAAGARRRRLGVPGEEEFNGKGVAYCSTCDAPLFSGKKVVVVGGGNAGLEAVQDLFPYASEVWMLERADALRGDQVTQEEVRKNPKFKGVIFGAEVIKITGDQFVSAVGYKDIKTGEEKTLAAEGIFIEIGSLPNSEMVKGLVDLDAWGQVKIDSKHASTSHPGVYAAGDITDDPYKQNNISAGDAVKAALAAYQYLLKRGQTNPA